jgi:hypothetical protein
MLVDYEKYPWAVLVAKTQDPNKPSQEYAFHLRLPTPLGGFSAWPYLNGEKTVVPFGLRIEERKGLVVVRVKLEIMAKIMLERQF